jgi:hypothetical protein
MTLLALYMLALPAGSPRLTPSGAHRTLGSSVERVGRSPRPDVQAGEESPDSKGSVLANGQRG